MGERHKGFCYVLLLAFKSEFSLVKSEEKWNAEIPPCLYEAFLFCPQNKKTLDYYWTVKMLGSMAAIKERVLFLLVRFHICGFNFHIHTLMHTITILFAHQLEPWVVYYQASLLGPVLAHQWRAWGKLAFYILHRDREKVFFQLVLLFPLTTFLSCYLCHHVFIPSSFQLLPSFFLDSVAFENSLWLHEYLVT